MDTLKELLGSVPPGLQAAFAAVGLLYASVRLWTSLGFLLDLFVLGGTNVSASGPRSPPLPSLTVRSTA